MEFEFDKEIDAILRKARESDLALAANAQASHLDADELSAFAENALPEKAKQLYTKHLADCDRCRRILSNIISLNSENETVPAFAAAEEKQVVPAAPWYRRLFVFPNLAYSLGALVLVFGGLIGFTLLQSFNNAEVSQVSNTAPQSKSAPVSAANNTMMMNSVATNSNSASVSSSNSASNSAAVQSNAVPGESRPNAAASKDNSCQDCGSGDETISPQPTVEADKDVLAQQSQRAETLKSNDAETKTTQEREQAENSPTTGSSSATRQVNKPDPVRKKEVPNPSSTVTGETSKINGKTFTRKDNVWYDAAYSGQSTTNITRGSNEYKKLDQGLRQTVERLGGTVVVVWKGKAYRIQ